MYGLNFQRIVIIIAIIMLIGSLIVIGYALYKQTGAIKWPPEMPKCPDYWKYDATSKKCTNPDPTMTHCEYNGIPSPTCPT
jgi:hypothetical protein